MGDQQIHAGVGLDAGAGHREFRAISLCKG